jgi:hypothetical protein
MTVINTSPAIHLHAVLPGGLGSLPRLIGEIIVPWDINLRTSAIAGTGTLGILIQAKRAAQIPSVKAAIATLENRGMWLDPAVAAKAISLAGEHS